MKQIKWLQYSYCLGFTATDASRRKHREYQMEDFWEAGGQEMAPDAFDQRPGWVLVGLLFSVFGQL